jgi:G3E family GTPase
MKLCLIGGFLGSGKTTAIATACKSFLKENRAVAVITNDQGSQLVDTAFINSLNIPGGDVKNGCFCCNYQQFFSAVKDLTASNHPDIIFAEAVGSCADLVATIVKPTLRFNPEIETTLSVFTDGPMLISSLEGRSSFVSEEIQYIYKKQLEEAQILIVNKSDILSKDEINKIRSVLRSEYPGKKLLFQDSKDESSVNKWLNVLNDSNTAKISESLDIDYKKYAEGEAALAWLDASIMIHSKGTAINKSVDLIDDIVERILTLRLPIGHLKFFLQSGDWKEKVSYTAKEHINKRHDMNNPAANHASLLVNARVEADPDELKRIFYQAVQKIEDLNCRIDVLKLDSFQPGYPNPTYRFEE